MDNVHNPLQRAKNTTHRPSICTWWSKQLPLLALPRDAGAQFKGVGITNFMEKQYRRSAFNRGGVWSIWVYRIRYLNPHLASKTHPNIESTLRRLNSPSVNDSAEEITDIHLQKEIKIHTTTRFYDRCCRYLQFFGPQWITSQLLYNECRAKRWLP